MLIVRTCFLKSNINKIAIFTYTNSILIFIYSTSIIILFVSHFIKVNKKVARISTL